MLKFFFISYIYIMTLDEPSYGMDTFKGSNLMFNSMNEDHSDDLVIYE